MLRIYMLPWTLLCPLPTNVCAAHICLSITALRHLVLCPAQPMSVLYTFHALCIYIDGSTYLCKHCLALPTLILECVLDVAP